MKNNFRSDSTDTADESFDFDDDFTSGKSK